MARRRVTPQSVAEQHVISGTDQTAMLDVKYINPTKGRGVFALSPFQKRDFVVEYRGQLIDLEESERGRRIYNAKCLGFMFDFMWHGKKWCIDAAMEDGSLGRLVNDDHVHPNCRMKRILVGRKPHLCLFAVRDIHSGEEITYDYGDDNWPWREKADGDSPDEAVENPVMQQEEVSPPSLQADGDSPNEAVENPVMQQEEVSPPSLQADGDSPNEAVENPVMQQEEVSPPSLQSGSGDSFVKDLENSSFVCSSSMVLQHKKVFEKAKSTLVTYSDSSESAISSSTKEDVPPSTMQSKEKIPFGLDLSDSSMKHGEDDARQMIVPRLRRTKSIFCEV
ncbi:inactive histone-lysine N-methyltransferase 2E-like [Boleophthalmus pectinirostris]|uniref:inactive histone-lysine N-methyltransferase 2E-like n=1 Tax=Boleophthalmus pectinirostris TaxID=150288 RepID=UPI00242DD9A8|nr:inactive histone-lysine N-methyltransferase 2E-like [Boleophthalmus pectinirostris]